ncbi:hypothetical protein TNCV_4752711 [Trichonephila clavipes]|nr:hypothetical protein TNCV_4752711 [Trichonephila clavipes]
MAHENIKWTETLPAVLLGLRVAVKPDINASSAELVVKPAFVFKDLPDTITDPIISAESSHRHPVTTNMQTTKSGRRSFQGREKRFHATPERRLRQGSKDMLDRSKDMLDRSKDMLDRSHDMLDRSHDMLDRSHDMLDRSHDMLDRSMTCWTGPMTCWTGQMTCWTGQMK